MAQRSQAIAEPPASARRALQTQLIIIFFTINLLFFEEII
jgi:hypothetical protein